MINSLTMINRSISTSRYQASNRAPGLKPPWLTYKNCLPPWFPTMERWQPQIRSCGRSFCWLQNRNVGTALEPEIGLDKCESSPWWKWLGTVRIDCKWMQMVRDAYRIVREQTHTNTQCILGHDWLRSNLMLLRMMVSCPIATTFLLQRRDDCCLILASNKVGHQTFLAHAAWHWRWWWCL